MNQIYIPLGLDCSVAYQLDKHNLRHFALPFDWSYTKNLLTIIELIDNNFSNFYPCNASLDELEKIYNIIEIKTNNYALEQSTIINSTIINSTIINSTIINTTTTITNTTAIINTTSEISKYKIKHKKYNIIFPHEFKSLSSEHIQIFIDKYLNRIKRFYDLNQINNKLIFIRLGTNKDLKYINLLNEILNKIFDKTINEIKFINSDKLSQTITTDNWQRNEYDWLNLLL